jgi:hypothetical protein
MSDIINLDVSSSLVAVGVSLFCDKTLIMMWFLLLLALLDGSVISLPVGTPLDVFA